MIRSGRSAGSGAIALVSVCLSVLCGAVMCAQAGMPDLKGASSAGEVVLGAQSRIVVEPVEEAVQVFYLLDISNTAQIPVNPSTPFAFDMPKGAAGTTILEGSSPLASVGGTRVTVLSPIPPGHTFVQVACELSAASGEVTIAQAFPAAMEQLTLAVKKVSGGTTLRSAMISSQREMPADGETFIAASGGAVAAGQLITFTVAGLPHHSRTPRTVALALVAVIIGIGIWGAGRTEDDPAMNAAEHKRLIARREKLFSELVRLETDRRAGRGDPRRYDARREEVVAALEQVYGALDEGAGPEPGNRAGQPAPLDRPGAA